MENNNIFSNKYNKILWIIFIAIVAINIIFASFTLKNSLLDGGTNFLTMIDGISNGKFKFIEDTFLLGFIYTFSHLILPFIVLLWNFKITKISGRKDIFAAGLFLYCFFIMLFQICPQIELSLYTMLLLLLYNYLCYTNEEYSRLDIFIILLISFLSFQNCAIVAFVAPLLYITAIRTFGKTIDGTVRIVKFITAVLIISAGIYNIWIMFNTPDEISIILEFFREFGNVLKYFLFSNVLISFTGIILLFFCNIKKIFDKEILLFIAVIGGLLIYMIYSPDKYFNPTFESSTRVLLALIFPITLLILVIFDYLKKNFSDEFLCNLITVALLIGIAQNIWQINNSYLWNNNSENLKNKLTYYENIKYFPNNNNIFAIDNLNLFSYNERKF